MLILICSNNLRQNFEKKATRDYIKNNILCINCVMLLIKAVIFFFFVIFLSAIKLFSVIKYLPVYAVCYFSFDEIPLSLESRCTLTMNAAYIA